ncbi:TetR/AcrR family transcriptional regulator [Rhodococcus gannanensis]|uniref:TetR/AcrR family transcriptional regulator n=1 Tax=Rhodococcus gannanensis TaxID=1960308 RepID=A0ABW4P9X4_9NOCA
MRDEDGFANRIAQRALAKREADYAGEVRRLLDAGLDVMRGCGTDSRPRVADIVAAAGLSNDAFYRHFRSKDALVAAILEDGTERLTTYVAHQMGKESTPDGQVRRWVEGVLSQSARDTAATTRAVLWNAGGLPADTTLGPASATGRLGLLLHRPFSELGSPQAEFDAALAAHATVGLLVDHLGRGAQTGTADVDRVVAFCLRVGGRSGACAADFVT